MSTAREATGSFERTPPQNIPAERAVLGSMLINPEAVAAAFEILREDPADLFYVPAHQFIFSSITTLFSARIRVDEITVSEQLTRDGHLEDAGGYPYLAELTGAAPLSSSVEYYAQIVLDNAVLRKLITQCTRIATDAFTHEGEVSSLLDSAESMIFRIAEGRQLTTITPVSDLIEDTIHRIEELKASGAGVTGLSTGFPELDHMLSGFQPSDMIVLAARPSVGKTAFALNFGRYAGVHLKQGVLIFSLEMSKEQLMLRLFCMQGGIDFKRLREGFLSQREFARIQEAADKLSRAPIFIDDTPNLSVMDVRARARRHAAKHDTKLIIIDYLQLMTGGGRRNSESRQVEISDISRGIKGIARELRVPVIALSQLSREAEKDESGLPKLAHLRESGAIEQDADVVMMLARPPKEDKEKIEAGIITVAIAKQRNGPTGNIELIFEGRFQQFRSLAAAGRTGEPPMDADASGPPPPSMPAGGGMAAPPPYDVDDPPFVEENVEDEGDVPF